MRRAVRFYLKTSNHEYIDDLEIFGIVYEDRTATGSLCHKLRVSDCDLATICNMDDKRTKRASFVQLANFLDVHANECKIMNERKPRKPKYQPALTPEEFTGR